MTETYILNRYATPPVLIFDKSYNLGRPLGLTYTAEIYHRFTSNDEGSRWRYEWRVPHNRRIYGITIEGDTNSGAYYIILPDGEMDNLGRITGTTETGIITKLNFALITRPVPTVRMVTGTGQSYELVGQAAIYPAIGSSVMQTIRLRHDAYDASTVNGFVQVTHSHLAL